MRQAHRHLLAAIVFAAGVPAAHAGNLPQALTALGASEKAFHSRTCGLVLLSAGRAQIRQENSKPAPAYDGALGQLTDAFLLLRDGAAVTDRAAPRAFFAEQLSTGNTTRPAQQALPGAVTHCAHWFNARKRSADFDVSQEAIWSALEQAQVTLRSE